MQAGAKIVHAGGTTVSPGKHSYLCKAFAKAVTKWCDPNRQKNGKEFADYVMDELPGIKPNGAAYAAQITSEVPTVAKWASGTGASTVTAYTAAKAGTPIGAALAAIAGPIAQAASSLASGAMTRGQYRRHMNNLVGNAIGGRRRMRYPDGMINGQPIEIKGPTDKFGPGQLEDYNQIDPNKPTIEVSCKSCGHKCANGNKCP